MLIITARSVANYTVVGHTTTHILHSRGNANEVDKISLSNLGNQSEVYGERSRRCTSVLYRGSFT